MYCLVGGFHWSLALDGHCPRHGTHDRWGRKRGEADVFCGEDGPHDVHDGSHGVPYLNCCSIPDEED